MTAEPAGEESFGTPLRDKSEAQPIPGQTCPIEPAPGATRIQAREYDLGGPHVFAPLEWQYRRSANGRA